MKKLLLDVNIVLDVLLDREPHARAAAAVWRAVESRQVEGFLSAHAITTVHYFVARQFGQKRAAEVISTMLGVFEVAAVSGRTLREAVLLQCPDFEDAVAAAAAHQGGCDFIVTRDLRGFNNSPVRVLAPEAAAALLDAL
jgi:predicted nucleic acid-binding protein